MIDVRNRRSWIAGFALALAGVAGCIDEDAADVHDVWPGTYHVLGSDASRHPEFHHGTIVTSAGEMTIDYEVIDDQAVLDGDIVVPWGDFVERDGVRIARSATVTRNLLWANGVVPFLIDPNLPAGTVASVNAAITEWNTKTAIKLIPRTTEGDYVVFVPSAGCASYAGRTGGAQAIQLAGNCTTQGAIHEIGHAIGLWHEQSRADRDNFVVINFSNIPQQNFSDFNKYSAGYDIGPYDYNSVMEYSSTAWAINPSIPTIFKPNGALIFQGSQLSPGDLIGVEWLYGPPYQVGRAIGMNLDGRLVAFVKATDGSIRYTSESSPGSTWAGWWSLGGNVRSTPTVGRDLDGRLEVFAVGFDNHIYHQWQQWNGTWSGWANLGGSIAGLPMVARNLDGRLEVFGRGTDGAIWHVWQTSPNGGWGTPVSLGGSFTGNPTIAPDQDGRLDVFAIGTNHALQHVTQLAPNGNWGNWASLGGSVQGSPAFGRNLDGRLEVFATGTDGKLQEVVQSAADSSTYGSWINFQVPVLGSPGVGLNNDGRLEVYVVDVNGQLDHMWQLSAGGAYSGLAAFGLATSTRTPDVGVDFDSRQDVLAVSGGTLFQNAQAAPNGGWLSWWQIPGVTVVPE